MIAIRPQTMGDRLPPMNLEAEEAVLGGILLDPGAIEIVANLLSPEHFSFKSHQQIYRAAQSLHSSGKSTDLMQVTTWLYDRNLLDIIGGQNKLAQLVDRTVSACNIDTYAQLILDKYHRRRLIDLGSDISSVGYESATDLPELLTYIQEQTLNVTQSITLGGGLRDVEELEHQRLINEISTIELSIEDPSLRHLKLIRLAKKFNLNLNQLEIIYFKSLLNEEDEPAMNLTEFREKYGNSVNEWLLHGFLAKGKVTLLYGKGGIGKTRLAYDFIYHLVTGQSWNGFPVTAKQRKVLLIQTDEAQGDTLKAVYDRGFTESLPVYYKSRWMVDHIQKLDKEIERLKPDEIVIDSLTSISVNSLYSENDVAYARPVLLLKALAQKHGCHITLIHHANGEGKPRGTSAIVNAVSDVICISASAFDQRPGSVERLLKIEKSRSRAPAVYELMYNADDNSWLCLGNQAELSGDSTSLTIKDKIVQFLQSHPNTVYEASEIQEAIGGQLPSVRRYANDLAKDGIISSKRLDTQPGRPNGYWISTEGGYLPDYIPPDREALAKVKAELRAASEDRDDHPDDHPTITPDDHPTNPLTESDSAKGDRPIVKNGNFLDAKKLKIDDHTITNCNEITESVTQLELQNCKVGDRRGDRGVIVIEESDRPPAFNIGDTVATSDPYSTQYTWHGCIENSRGNGEEWLVRWAERKGKPGRETDWYFTSELRLVEEAIAKQELKPVASVEDFEIGDKVWVEVVLRNPPYSGEATVTAVGNKYLSVEIGGQKLPCEKSEAKILSRAEATTSTDEENAIAPPLVALHQEKTVPIAELEGIPTHE